MMERRGTGGILRSSWRQYTPNRAAGEAFRPLRLTPSSSPYSAIR